MDGGIGDVMIGLGGGSVSVGGVAWYFFQRMLSRQDKLADRIERIEDDDIMTMKARLTHIEQNCRSETNAQAISDMKPMLARIEGKVDQAAKDIAKIEQWEGWISDVRKEERDTATRLIEHMTDAAIHAGGKRHA